MNYIVLNEQRFQRLALRAGVPVDQISDWIETLKRMIALDGGPERYLVLDTTDQDLFPAVRYAQDHLHRVLAKRSQQKLFSKNIKPGA